MFPVDTASLKHEFHKKDLKKLISTVILVELQRLFYKLFTDFDFTFKTSDNNYDREYFTMDNKLIQFIIKQIVESDNYTLEGISRYTRIPYDVVYDAACGRIDNLSAPSWIRIIDLYLQVNPEITDTLIRELIKKLQIQDNRNYVISNMLRCFCSPEK